MPEQPNAEHPQPEHDALSPVLENYIETIFMEEAYEGAARASSIADAVGVSRSTVTRALRILSSMGLVRHTPYGLIHLTEQGRCIGSDIAHRHIIFREFFLNVLQLDESQADAVACRLEHVVPPDVILRWGQFVLYLTSREDWKNWREEYLQRRPELVRGMTETYQKMENLANREAMRRLARKYR